MSDPSEIIVEGFTLEELRYAYDTFLWLTMANMAFFPVGLVLYKTRIGFYDQFDIAFWSVGAFWSFAVYGIFALIFSLAKLAAVH